GDDQLTSGTWQFFKTDKAGNKALVKEWVFEKNQFSRKVIHIDGDTISFKLSVVAENDSLLEGVELNEDYLTIVDLKASLENQKLPEKYRNEYRIRDLFFSALKKFNSADSTFSPVLKNSIAPKIYTKILRFPYTDEEEETLKELQAKTKDAEKAIRKIKNDPQINLARISTQEVAFYISVLNAIERNFLMPNREIVKHYKSGNLAYINREKFLDNRLNQSLVELDVMTVFNNDTTTGKYSLREINADNKGDSFENLGNLAEDILSEIGLLRDSIDIYIEEIKREENLSEIEGLLIEKYESVNQLNDSLIGKAHRQLGGFDANKAIDEFIEETLKNYSNIKSTEEKMDEVEQALECLNEVEELIYAVQKAPENSFTIRDAYTKKVFNPYTFTEMEEKAKPSIYKSFETVLMPAVMGNLQNLKCNKISAYTENFDNLFEGMIEILKRGDTNKEERKVKRTKDASKTADILGLKMSF
ncbi:MAG: hypothetical protein LC664_00360, partial [Flavobacteriales bacterium]|nr:hypothetical protein [Flavobacteriales bacterium]